MNKIYLKLKKFLKFKFLIIGIITLYIILIISGISAQRAASIFVWPDKGTYAGEFNIDVYVTSEEEYINSISGDISFPADKIQVKSIDTTDTIIEAWITGPTFSNSTGEISFGGVMVNEFFQGSNGKVFSINFTPIGTGTANLKFTNASIMLNDVTGIEALFGTGGGTYTLVSSEDQVPAPPTGTQEINPVITEESFDNVTVRPTAASPWGIGDDEEIIDNLDLRPSAPDQEATGGEVPATTEESTTETEATTEEAIAQEEVEAEVATEEVIAEPEEPTLPTVKYEDEVLSTFEINPFPDTNIDSPEGKAAAELHRRSVIAGFPDGEFKGSRNINRAEAAKILLLSKGIETPNVFNDRRFWDVKEGEWYEKYVIAASENEIINGYPDGTFKPEDSVNTAEFLKMITLAFNLQKNLIHTYTDVKPDDWFAQYAGIVPKYNLFPQRSSTKLQPGKTLTRNEIAVAIYQYLKNDQRRYNLN